MVSACVDNIAKSSETAQEKKRLVTQEKFLVAALVPGNSASMGVLS